MENEIVDKMLSFRREWKSKSLKLKNPDEAHKLNIEQKVENVKLRLKDLSKILNELYKIYKTNEKLYGDEFLAVVGDKVIRHWPWKDIAFTSQEAQKATGKKVFEHWTPISFFRDLFQLEGLTDEHFYYALKRYYRTVIITEEENQKLNKLKYKTTRPETAYIEAGIKIYEQELWTKLYGPLEESNNKM